MVSMRMGSQTEPLLSRGIAGVFPPRKRQIMAVFRAFADGAAEGVSNEQGILFY